MEEKVDRRIRRTKESLKKGLAILLEEKSINEISVKELVQTAHVNRSTFYLHYSDIYNLMNEVEQQLFQEINDVLENHSSIEKKNNFQFLEDFYTVIGKNKDIFRALMGKHGDANFLYGVKKKISGLVTAQLKKHYPGIEEDFKYTLNFCMTGCIGILTRWLFYDEKESPEHMASVTYELVRHALGVCRKDYYFRGGNA